MTDYDVPADPCPNCGRDLPGADSVPGNSGEPPAAGDLGLCVYCGALHRFAEDLTKRPATDAELETLDPVTTKQIRAVREAWVASRDL